MRERLVIPKTSKMEQRTLRLKKKVEKKDLRERLSCAPIGRDREIHFHLIAAGTFYQISQPLISANAFSLCPASGERRTLTVSRMPWTAFSFCIEVELGATPSRAPRLSIPPLSTVNSTACARHDCLNRSDDRTTIVGL